MINIKRNVLSVMGILLAFVMVFTILPITAKADETTETTEILEPCNWTVTENDTILGMKGSFIYEDIQEVVEYINEIRWAACVEGLVDPRDTSRNLTTEDYVPIQWSDELSKIAMYRAVEGRIRSYMGLSMVTDDDVTNCHRMIASSHKGWIYVQYNDDVQSCAECMGAGYDTLCKSISAQYYMEKQEYENQSGEYGHYKALINPNNVYFGMANFTDADNNSSTNTMEFGRALDSSKISQYEQQGDKVDGEDGFYYYKAVPATTTKNNVLQKVIVGNDFIEKYILDGDDILSANSTVSLIPKAVLCYNGSIYSAEAYCLDTLTYTSSDSSIATVDSNGVVTAKAEGTVTITAKKTDGTAFKTGLGEVSEISKEITVCNHTETEVKNAVEKTCSADGYTGDTYCVKCGTLLQKGEVISAGCEFVLIEGKAATCIEAGYKEYWQCKNCKEIIWYKENGVYYSINDPSLSGRTSETSWKTSKAKIAATGIHTWDEGTVTKEATEDAEGVMTYTCTVCGTTKTESIDKLAHVHSWTISSHKSETCTTAGSITYKCSCGETKTEVIPATGHTEVAIKGKSATCTESGLTDGSKCSVCNAVITAQETIPATGHKWNEGEVKSNGLCGGTVRTDTCANCGETQTVVVSEGKHTEETIEGKAATCTENGLTDGIKCSVCGATLKEQEVIPATEHKNTELRNSKKATCIEEGYTGDTYCKDCNTLLSEGKTIPVTDHTKGTAVKENVKVATYTASGSYESVVYCTVCGKELSRDTVTVAKLSKLTNPMKLKTASKTLKYKTLKSKKQSFTIAFKTKAQGTVTYTLNSKAKKAKIKVSAKGKVTVPKGCKKGTYKITVKAAGNSKYKALSKTFTIKVK